MCAEGGKWERREICSRLNPARPGCLSIPREQPCADLKVSTFHHLSVKVRCSILTRKPRA